MYVRELKRKTTQNIAVQIVESYRNRDGQPRVRIIRHMGSVRPEAVDGLVKIAYLELARIQEERQPSLFPAESYVDEVVEARRKTRESQALVIQDARKLEEVRRICLGFHEVIGGLYDRMRFADVFGSRQQMARRLFKQAVLLRLAAPGESKLAHARQMSKDVGVDVPVDKFYRMMDAVTDDRIAQWKQLVSEETVGLLGGKLEMLFFDVTTLSFASEQSDELRKAPLVLALIQTKEGLPITYELFPGNTTDVKTLEPAMQDLQARFDLDRLIVVADSGMLSKENLAVLQSLGCDYIVAARLRSLSQRHTKKILGEQTWQELATGRKVTEDTLGGRRLILRHCPKKAARDVHSREQAVEKVTKRLKQTVKGPGKSGRFLKVEQDGVGVDKAGRAAPRTGLSTLWRVMAN